MNFKVAFFFVAILACVCADLTKNIIDAPVECPEGEKPDANGVCQIIWGRAAVINTGNGLRSIIQVPPSCPPCYQLDSRGVCRAVFGCDALVARIFQNIAKNA